MAFQFTIRTERMASTNHIPGVDVYVDASTGNEVLYSYWCPRCQDEASFDKQLVCKGCQTHLAG